MFDGWVQIQRKQFSKWVDSYLSKKGTLERFAYKLNNLPQKDLGFYLTMCELILNFEPKDILQKQMINRLLPMLVIPQ